MKMKNIRKFHKFYVVSLLLLIVLSFTSVKAIDVLEVQIWDYSGQNPNRYSDHTRCEVVYALEKYWLFYDWVEGSSGIFMMFSDDAQVWSDPVEIINTGENEAGVKAFFHRGMFHVFYYSIESYQLYIKTSEDGLTYTTAEMIYRFPDTLNPISEGWGYDIIVARNRYFLAFDDPIETGGSGDIFITKSSDLTTAGWELPIRVMTNPGVTDYAPDLLWAKGKIWLVWDYIGDDDFSDVWLTSSRDGIIWDTPWPMHNLADENNIWGPFSLIWEKGQFIFVTRISTHDFPWKWRIAYSISNNGVTWSHFEYLTSDPGIDHSQEKGATVFPIYDDELAYTYSSIFKRTTGPFELVQVFFNP
jgi:hypothetical protein